MKIHCISKGSSKIYPLDPINYNLSTIVPKNNEICVHRQEKQNGPHSILVDPHDMQPTVPNHEAHYPALFCSHGMTEISFIFLQNAQETFCIQQFFWGIFQKYPKVCPLRHKTLSFF